MSQINTDIQTLTQRVKQGHEYKLYINITGTFAIPVWTLIDNARNVSTNPNESLVEARTRRTGADMSYQYGDRDWEISFEMVPDPADANYTAIREAWIDRAVVDVAALSGLVDTVGSEGPRFIAVVQFNERGESEADPVFQTITLKPANVLAAANRPTWMIVEA